MPRPTKTQNPFERTKRPASLAQTSDAPGGKRRKSLARGVTVAAAAEKGRAQEKRQFEPPVEDSQGRFGDISYAKSWCGFANPRKMTTLYKKWREEVKAHIIDRAWDPTNMTDAQLASVLAFARSLRPVSARFEELKRSYPKSDVGELERQMKILVKDAAKKLQTTFERRHGGTGSVGAREEGLSGKTDWTSPFCPRAVRIHIVRRTGAPAAEHAFLNHPWYPTDPDRGVAWGVLEKPDMRHLLEAIKSQSVESEIGYPRYLIGATSHGARSLRREPQVPLPLSDLIFLYKDDDIRAWLLANQQEGKDPLDLLLLEPRQEEGEDPGLTPEPPGGRYPFLDRDVWERGGEEEFGGVTFSEDDDSGDEDQVVDEDLDEDVDVDVDPHDDEDEDQDVGDEESVALSGAALIIDDDDQNDSEPRNRRESRSGTYSSHRSDSTSGESFNPPPPSAPARFTLSDKPPKRVFLSKASPTKPTTPHPRRRSARRRSQGLLSSAHQITHSTTAGPVTTRNEPPPPSGHRRRSAASGSGRSGPSNEEKAREARAILKEKPWLVDFMGGEHSGRSGIGTTPVGYDHGHDGSRDSIPAAGDTEIGVVPLVETTPSASDTLTPRPPTLDAVHTPPNFLATLSASAARPATPPTLDPVPPPPLSHTTPTTSVAPPATPTAPKTTLRLPPATPTAPNTTLPPATPTAPNTTLPPATPTAPNTTLVPSSPAAPTSKGTAGQGIRKKRRSGRRH